MEADGIRVVTLIGGIALLGLVWGLNLDGAPVASAGERSPEGRWRTIDDGTGKPKSIVRLWLEEGVLVGRVEELLRGPDEDPNPVCDLCTDERKDQPLKGMMIIWGLTRDRDGDHEWSGGYVLDPENGKTYRCIIRVDESGRKVHVRGYIGFSFIGRTQTWHRVQ